MTTVTRKLPVPFSVVYSPDVNPEDFLRGRVLELCNDYIEISEFQILDEPLQVSQSAPAVIYTVSYSLKETIPVRGKRYAGVVKNLTEQGGAYVGVPFKVFVQLKGKRLSPGDSVEIIICGIRQNPDGYLCVGTLV